MSTRLSNTSRIDEVFNPLDSVEEILDANNWCFNRMTEEELVVTVQGLHGDYTLFFIWQEEFEALQFCCQFDMHIPRESAEKTRHMLPDLNANLWLGHFELMGKHNVPSFRHTCLYRGLNKNEIGPAHIEDLVEIALAQCERHFPVFSLLTNDGGIQEQTLALAMMNAEGRS